MTLYPDATVRQGMEAIPTRVQRGAAWLDANQPGWWNEIRLATLNIAGNCVVQQLDDCSERLYDLLVCDFGEHYPYQLGFDSDVHYSRPTDDSPEHDRRLIREAAHLTDAWVNLIEARLASHGATP